MQATRVNNNLVTATDLLALSTGGHVCILYSAAFTHGGRGTVLDGARHVLRQHVVRVQRCNQSIN